ncbi:MAG: dipicolinate synthase subunit DpsA [Firmicutes bacterium]|nr:dipicolinate synthase subunit DpsA [Bacillota bacterium]
MQATLAGIRILVLGGDHREVEMVRCLARQGGEVYTVGHRPYPGYENVLQVESLGPFPEAIPKVDAIIAPMSHTDSTGKVRAVPEEGVTIWLDDRLFERFPPGTPLFIGKALPVVKETAGRWGIRLFETAEDDEIAVLNSIPTAEGAIQIAMEELPITLHGSRSLVLGLGRCGLTLVRMLKGLGVKVTAAARNRAQLARAAEMGAEAVPLDALGEVVPAVDVVFNTIPALVLTRELLEKMPKEALIIDIASSPGGVDFEAAADLGIKGILAPGLPGKVAPITAGRILGKCLPRMILSALSSEGETPAKS